MPGRKRATGRAYQKVGLSGGRRQFCVYKANCHVHVSSIDPAFPIPYGYFLRLVQLQTTCMTGLAPRPERSAELRDVELSESAPGPVGIRRGLPEAAGHRLLQAYNAHSRWQLVSARGRGGAQIVHPGALGPRTTDYESSVPGNDPAVLPTGHLPSCEK